MQYLPTFGFKFMVNVGKYTIHGYDSDMIYLRMFSFSEIILEGDFFRTNRGVIVGVFLRPVSCRFFVGADEG